MPGRAAGDVSLSLDAWHGDDRDGSEPQREREARQAAAMEVCLNCPVMVACDAYANAVVAEDGKTRLAEPAGIWGGRLALERHRAFIKRRHEVAVAAPVRAVKTPQRLRVLEALAVHADAEAVAEAAGVDVRTANWQRSRLVTQLNLDKGSATRRELLAAAVERGLLDARVVVGDDGLVPAVPPPSPSSRLSSAGSEAGVDDAVLPSVPAVLRGRVRRPGRRRVQVMPGQLSLDDALAPVLNLFPNNEILESAA
ncbi:WhiB family transcriptional regulator (plasmid) [Streptomyces sp. NBC_01723]|uniref:WhiB family transcriptional regulator n=1 Tax=Streptomyces sp. NBC_01723 TaxID=2975921 RepID=UPI002E368609|nr:WhiB family transcriptional regulator [Streptomyces sp. NBC_01723]